MWATGSQEDVINSTGEYFWLFQCRTPRSLRLIRVSMIAAHQYPLQTSVRWECGAGPAAAESDTAVKRVLG